MDYKKTKADTSIQTRNLNDFSNVTGNVYETIAMLSKRSDQIAADLKQELYKKIEEFSVGDNADEMSENHEQIEVAKYYEQLPKPYLIAIKEYLDDKLVYKKPETVAQEETAKQKEAPDSLKQSVFDEFNNSKVVKEVNRILTRDGVHDIVVPIVDTYNYRRLLAATDSLGWNKTQQDIAIATMLYAYIDHERQPLKLHFLEFADANIQHEAAKKAILELNDKYEAIGKRVLSTDNLKSNDDIKNLSEGEQIMRKLIEPYKGKLVLLDIWGTWCGPCKEALSHSQEEYERLKDYPIVYLYLANRSPDESWKNIIKEYNVTGDNVVHYNLPATQQKAIENYLKVNSFPTYKLFDQQGNLFDINADPRDLEKFEALLKLVTGK